MDPPKKKAPAANLRERVERLESRADGLLVLLALLLVNILLVAIRMGAIKEDIHLIFQTLDSVHEGFQVVCDFLMKFVR